MFDLDNTITPSHSNKPTKRLKKLFDDLKDKGFKIIIVSNAPKYRIEPFKSYLNVDACAFAIKPRNNRITVYILLRAIKLYKNRCFMYIDYIINKHIEQFFFL